MLFLKFDHILLSVEERKKSPTDQKHIIQSVTFFIESLRYLY